MNPNDLQTLQGFVSRAQMRCILDGCRGEEGNHFRAKLSEYTQRITEMPKTYETDGQGEAAIAQLHYFVGGCDLFITERDVDTDGEGQIQAFGLADLGYGPELGYISIAEAIAHGAELDLYWTPRTVGDIRAEREQVPA